jgi:hypothetical protein
MINNELETIRELATHSADIKHIEADMDKMVKDIEEIKETLRDITAILAEAKGGWKLLLMVGGLGASIATVFAWVIDMVKPQ